MGWIDVEDSEFEGLLIPDAGNHIDYQWVWQQVEAFHRSA